MRDLTELARKAATQHGLLLVADLRSAGCSERSRTTLVATGVLVRVRRGLFRLAGAPETWEQTVMAACLGAGGRGVASHRTALRLWDLRPRDDVVEVTVRGVTTPMVQGAVVHRSYDLVPADVSRVDGLPVTNPARTLCDAGVLFPEWRVSQLVEVAIAKGIVGADEIRALRERVGRHGRTGVAAADTALAGLPTGPTLAESPKEMQLKQLIERSHLPAPSMQHPIDVDGHRFRADFAYPDQRVIVEYDGFVEHTSSEQFTRDRRRQNLLTINGWLVLRFSNADLRERPGWIVREIDVALRTAGRSGARNPR